MSARSPARLALFDLDNTLIAADSDHLWGEFLCRRGIVDGADFAEIAREHSDYPSSRQGGELGVIARGQLVPAIEEAVFAQQTNTIGPVLSVDDGYHIIEVQERIPPHTMASNALTLSPLSTAVPLSPQP